MHGQLKKKHKKDIKRATNSVPKIEKHKEPIMGKALVFRCTNLLKEHRL